MLFTIIRGRREPSILPTLKVDILHCLFKWDADDLGQLVHQLLDSIRFLAVGLLVWFLEWNLGFVDLLRA